MTISDYYFSRKRVPGYAFSSGPGANAKVEYSRRSEREIVAEVDSEQEYLVALGERNWDDFDPS